MLTPKELLTELRRRRDETQSQLKKINFTIGVFEAIGPGFGDAKFPANFLIEPPPTPLKIDDKRTVSPAEVVHLVTSLLQEKGEPMTRGEIARALEEQGVKLPGRDVYKNVGTILWRNQDRFVNLEKRGYWLADAPLPGPSPQGDTHDD